MGTIHRCTMIGTYIGQTFNNVLNFNDDSGTMTPGAVAAELANNWVGHARLYQSNLVIYTAIRVQPLLPGPPAAALLPLNVIGSKATPGGELPFVAGVVRIATEFGGRHGRGRFYLAGMHAWPMTNGLFRQAEYDATLQGILVKGLEDRFKVPGGTSSLKLGVMGKATTSTWIGMRSLSLRVVPALQRRRNIGVGQ